MDSRIKSQRPDGDINELKILHIVPGTKDVSNGMVVVARLLAKEHGDAEVIDLNAGLNAVVRDDVEEVWVHGMWLPKEWRVCCAVLRSGKRLVRMTHGSLSPVYLKHQSPFKKRLVSPIEHDLLRRADKIVSTSEVESDWIRAYEPRVKSIEITDLKRFFDLNHVDHAEQIEGRPLHLLYLGRRHPLKGLEFLEAAVKQIQGSIYPACSTWLNKMELKVVNDAFGEEKEKVWLWCDVLVLPTLSENFGLAIAEALERGKKVITTDGAPAWGDGNTYGGRLTYLKGYFEANAEKRVDMLKGAIEDLVISEKGSIVK